MATLRFLHIFFLPSALSIASITRTPTRPGRRQQQDVICPSSIIPGEPCDVSVEEGLICGFDRIWTGCTESELECTPILSCKCNEFQDGTWACLSMGMMELCIDTETTPPLRGESCTEGEVLEARIEPGLNNGNAFEVSETKMPQQTPPSSLESIPISFVGLNYNSRKGADWMADRERCKTRNEVVRDLMILSRLTNQLRILSLNDCNQGEIVLSILSNELREKNMKLWLGLWVEPDPDGFQNEVTMLESILQQNVDLSLLLGISVGSEAIYREEVTIEEAITNLEIVKELLRRYSVNVPTAIVDIAPIYSNSQELRLASDVIMTNTFPFWEGISVDGAVNELDVDLKWLLNLPESRGKRFVLGEHGWPSDGYIEEVGVASPANQQQYMAESYCYLKEQGWEYYLFTGIDNRWRQIQDPENTIEGNWGFLTWDLKLKNHFVNFEFSCPDGSKYTFAKVDWSIPDLVAEDIDVSNASCQLWQHCEELAGNCCPTAAGDYLGCCRDEFFLGGERAETSFPSESVVVPFPEAPAFSVPNTSAPTLPPSQMVTTPSPSQRVTSYPTIPLTVLVTSNPTTKPTHYPTFSPTHSPTPSPSNPPTIRPTLAPTQYPTQPPTNLPTTEAPYSTKDPMGTFEQTMDSIDSFPATTVPLQDSVNAGDIGDDAIADQDIFKDYPWSDSLLEPDGAEFNSVIDNLNASSSTKTVGTKVQASLVLGFFISVYPFFFF